MVSSSAVVGLAMAYPESFYAATSCAGFDGSSDVSSKFPNDMSLLLYASYQQAMIEPCNIPKPRGWSPLEQGKWMSWNGLGNMTSTEAMRLFVKILEELQSVCSQLASEQSGSFKLEVDVAELRQKLQTMETLEREAASEEAALSARHRQYSGTRWSWLTGTPPSHKSDDDL